MDNQTPTMAEIRTARLAGTIENLFGSLIEEKPGRCIECGWHITWEQYERGRVITTSMCQCPSRVILP